MRWVFIQICHWRIVGIVLNTIGGATPAARNVISGNVFEGVGILGAGSDNNFVADNFIGTDKTGTVPLGNLQRGVNMNATAPYASLRSSRIRQRAIASKSGSRYQGKTGTAVSAVTAAEAS